MSSQPHGFTGNLSDHSNKFAEPDWLRMHHEAKADLRRKFAISLKIPPSSLILDVACGTGGWTETLSSVYPDCAVVGVDISYDNVLMARRLCEKARSTGQVTFICADVTRRPFAEETFDVVFVANSMYYSGVEAAIPSLYSFLKLDGRLILRNFDDGATLLFPCPPALHTKILAAAARVATPEPRNVDPYVGRRLRSILQKNFDEPTELHITPTRLDWPFTAAQRSFIAGYIAWLGATARPYIGAEEYEQWMALVDEQSATSIFRDPAAYYLVFDFCAQLQRKG